MNILSPILIMLWGKKWCFLSKRWEKLLVTAAFLSILFFEDLFYMDASAQYLPKMYYYSLRFVTNCEAFTHPGVGTMGFCLLSSSTWNMLQKHWRLTEPIEHFKVQT